MGTKNRRSGAQFNPKGMTQGVTLVCPGSGDPIDTVVDGDGFTRLRVDSNVTIDSASVTVDLDVDSDGVHIGDQNTGFLLTVEADGSINVNAELDANDGDNIAISSHPANKQIFDENADTITVAGFKEIFSYTSTSDNTRIIQVEVTVGTPSTIQIKIDGVIKRRLRSSSLEKNIIFHFKEHRTLTNAQVLTVEAKVDRLIHTTYDTFTALEGYLRI